MKRILISLSIIWLFVLVSFASGSRFGQFGLLDDPNASCSSSSSASSAGG